MRVVVTGGAGYIGSVVVETLLAERHDATVYDDLSEGHRDAVPVAATLVEADLLERAGLAATLRAARAEAVVHMAAVGRVAESVVNPAKCDRVNVVGGLARLDAMREAGVRRITAAVGARRPGDQDLAEIIASAWTFATSCA